MSADSHAPLFDIFDAITVENLWRSGSMKWQENGYIGAFVAEMDFGTAPTIAQRLGREIEHERFGYFPAQLAADLRDTTTDWLRTEQDWPVDSADIKPVSDVIRALEFAIANGCGGDRAVIVPTPAYKPFLMVPPMMNRRVIEVPMLESEDGYVFDLQALQAAFDAGGELLILCNPYNPGGRVFCREELQAISDLVERNGGRVFADEIWSPLIFPGHKHLPYANLSVTSARHSVTAISASKAWNMPGLKCAQLILSNDQDRENWSVTGPLFEHGVSNMGAVATIEAYRTGSGWRAGVMAYLDRNRSTLAKLVEEHIDGAVFRIPEGSYVGWLDFRRTPVGNHPAAFFREHAGVILSEGTDCGMAGAGFARFIFATPRPVMEMAIRRMGQALKNMR